MLRSLVGSEMCIRDRSCLYQAMAGCVMSISGCGGLCRVYIRLWLAVSCLYEAMAGCVVCIRLWLAVSWLYQAMAGCVVAVSGYGGLCRVCIRLWRAVSCLYQAMAGCRGCIRLWLAVSWLYQAIAGCVVAVSGYGGPCRARIMSNAICFNIIGCETCVNQVKLQLQGPKLQARTLPVAGINSVLDCKIVTWRTIELKLVHCVRMQMS